MPPKSLSPELVSIARRITVLLLDCDGVLTDGRLYFTEAGEAMKVFNVRDGQGIANWHKAGFETGIISGRGGEPIIRKRAEELGIAFVKTGSTDKVADAMAFLQTRQCGLDSVAYVGDDIGDLEMISAAGFSAAVADAADEVRAAAKYVTEAKGGTGAVREVIDLILTAKASGDQD